MVSNEIFSKKVRNLELQLLRSKAKNGIFESNAEGQWNESWTEPEWDLEHKSSPLFIVSRVQKRLNVSGRRDKW